MALALSTILNPTSYVLAGADFLADDEADGTYSVGHYTSSDSVTYNASTSIDTDETDACTTLATFCPSDQFVRIGNFDGSPDDTHSWFCYDFEGTYNAQNAKYLTLINVKDDW